MLFLFSINYDLTLLTIIDYWFWYTLRNKIWEGLFNHIWDELEYYNNYYKKWQISKNVLKTTLDKITRVNNNGWEKILVTCELIPDQFSLFKMQ